MVFALCRAQDLVKAGPLFSVRVHILPALQCWWILLGWGRACPGKQELITSAYCHLHHASLCLLFYWNQGLVCICCSVYSCIEACWLHGMYNVYHNQSLGKFSAGGFESCFLHWMCYITCLSDYSHHFLLVPQVRLTCICHIHCIVCCSYYILHAGRNSSSQVQCALFISILLYHSCWLIWHLQLELK